MLEEDFKIPQVKMCDCKQYMPMFDTCLPSLLRPNLSKVGHDDLDSVYP